VVEVRQVKTQGGDYESPITTVWNPSQIKDNPSASASVHVCSGTGYDTDLRSGSEISEADI
jgi:hypothetical protein